MREPDCDYPNEDDIKRLIKMGDFEGAFKLSLRRFWGEIKIKCEGSLQHYVDDPISEAESLTQKIFFEFYRILPGYDPRRASIRTLLHFIAKRKLIETWRAARRGALRYELVSFEFKHREPS